MQPTSITGSSNARQSQNDYENEQNILQSNCHKNFRKSRQNQQHGLQPATKCDVFYSNSSDDHDRHPTESTAVSRFDDDGYRYSFKTPSRAYIPASTRQKQARERDYLMTQYSEKRPTTTSQSNQKMLEPLFSSNCQIKQQSDRLDRIELEKEIEQEMQMIMARNEKRDVSNYTANMSSIDSDSEQINTYDVDTLVIMNENLRAKILKLKEKLDMNKMQDKYIQEIQQRLKHVEEERDQLKAENKRQKVVIRNGNMQACNIYKMDNKSKEKDDEVQQLIDKIEHLEFKNNEIMQITKQRMNKITQLEDTIKNFKIKEESLSFHKNNNDSLNEQIEQLKLNIDTKNQTISDLQNQLNVLHFSQDSLKKHLIREQHSNQNLRYQMGKVGKVSKHKKGDEKQQSVEDRPLDIKQIKSPEKSKKSEDSNDFLDRNRDMLLNLQSNSKPSPKQNYKLKLLEVDKNKMTDEERDRDQTPKRSKYARNKSTFLKDLKKFYDRKISHRRGNQVMTARGQEHSESPEMNANFQPELLIQPLAKPQIQSKNAQADEQHEEITGQKRQRIFSKRSTSQNRL